VFAPWSQVGRFGHSRKTSSWTWYSPRSTRKDLAARQSANGLLHDADARSALAQSFTNLTAYCPAGKVPDILLGDPSNISEYPCSV
jgi:hypothetical protein